MYQYQRYHDGPEFRVLSLIEHNLANRIPVPITINQYQPYPQSYGQPFMQTQTLASFSCNLCGGNHDRHTHICACGASGQHMPLDCPLRFLRR